MEKHILSSSIWLLKKTPAKKQIVNILFEQRDLSAMCNGNLANLSDPFPSTHNDPKSQDTGRGLSKSAGSGCVFASGLCTGTPVIANFPTSLTCDSVENKLEWKVRLVYHCPCKLRLAFISLTELKFQQLWAHMSMIQCAIVLGQGQQACFEPEWHVSKSSIAGTTLAVS